LKMRLLIATADSDYADHLSGVLSEKYPEMFELFVCTRDLPSGKKFEIALFGSEFLSWANLVSADLPLILADGNEYAGDYKSVFKYQRISSMVAGILEYYSQTGKATSGFPSVKGRIVAVWSAAGGSGKTTVALAYAAYRVSEGKKATYLSLENFAGTSAYFQGTGKSLSKVFEKFGSDIRMFAAAIRQTDAVSGISYFGEPENYEDMNILSIEDIEELISACAAETQELVIDLPSSCDSRVKKVFELADTVLLVSDPSAVSRAKLGQFVTQHDVFGKIQPKIVLANNKGAVADLDIGKSIRLPFVHSADPVSVFRALSKEKFDWAGE